MALKFTEALGEVQSDTSLDFLDYLKENAPNLVDEVSKDLTAGDVHVSSAGGDDKKPKKKKKPKVEPAVSVAYDPEKGFMDRGFGEDNTGNAAFDWFLHQVKGGEVAVSEVARPWDNEAFEQAVEKLKLKHSIKLEAEPSELKALTEALRTNPQIRSALEAALAASVGKAETTKNLMVMRHGATHLNDNDTSVDRVRGWKDVPLSDKGKKEAAKLAEKIAKDPPDHLVCSDLKRAHDTAKMVAAACDMKIDDANKGFRPWDVGKYAGVSSKEAVPILCRYATETPDTTIPEGESFNAFRQRFFKALSGAAKKYPGVLGMVTHHRNERLLTAWKEAGFPADGSMNAKEFTRKGEGTAGFETMEIPLDKLHAAAGTKVTKWIGTVDPDHIWEDSSYAADVSKDFTVEVKKVDQEQQIFYGWAYVSEENGQIVVDKQDDYIMPGDLVAAAEDFTLQGGKLGDMHDARNVGRVVASFVTSEELCKAFDLSVGNNRVGWILGFKVDNPDVWAKIKGGAQLELSIGGRAQREPDEG